MGQISNKNLRKFPELNIGDKVLVQNSAMSVTNGAQGVVIEADQKGRSPHKSMYKVHLRGLPESGNPWHLFRTELVKL